MEKTNSYGPDMGKEKLPELHPTESVVEANSSEIDDTRNGQFHRSFTTRQVHVSPTSQII
jgi:hypothetical protein